MMSQNPIFTIPPHSLPQEFEELVDVNRKRWEKYVRSVSGTCLSMLLTNPPMAGSDCMDTAKNACKNEIRNAIKENEMCLNEIRITAQLVVEYNALIKTAKQLSTSNEEDKLSLDYSTERLISDGARVHKLKKEFDANVQSQHVIEKQISEMEKHYPEITKHREKSE